MKEIALAEIQMQQCKKSTDEIQSSLRSFIDNAVDDLAHFQSEFAETLRLCYSNMSKLRRETNEEIRGNQKELQKVTSDLTICKSVLNDMIKKGEQLTN